MGEVELTRQQLDPAGTMGMRMLCCLLVACAFVYALVASLTSADQRSRPLFSVLALALFGFACIMLVVSTSAYRAPLRGRVHVVIHVITFVAVLADAAAQWGTDRYIVDDWGPVALGTVLLALAPYRPAREMASAGVISAALLGLLTLVETPGFVTPAPPAAFIVVSVAPMLALCFGGVAFSASIVSALQSWRRRADAASRDLLDELKAGVARSVQQDRVTILNRDVVPFFGDIVARGEVTDEDRARARSISDSIRRVMVADIDRSWLESVIDGLGAVDAAQSPAVVDPARLASMMTAHQRTAVRAFLLELLALPGFRRECLRVVLSRRKRTCLVVVTAGVELGELAIRSALSPYFAVMRVVFSDLQIDFEQRKLALRFSYEQR